MKFYEFGDINKPVIILLPGTCCHWKANFEKVVPLLEEDFHVVCVSYDGFDETEKTIFPDMLTETEKLESYIRQNYGGKIHAAYGCSMGGSFVGLLVQRRNVHISHAILGSSDMDQNEGFPAKWKARLVGKMLFSIFQKGRLPRFSYWWLGKRPADERAYYEKMMDMFNIGSNRMAFVKSESIRDQFYSDLVTPIENGISVQGTTVHIFYAVKMGKKYLDRYNSHFKNPDIRCHNMQHEELLVCHPERWTEEVKKCCGLLSEEKGEKNMGRYEEIQNTHKNLGGEATFYDGMIT